jgi:superfamily II DNA or RNA helicase
MSDTNVHNRITKKGYIIDKKNYTSDQIEKIKNDLTMQPKSFGTLGTVAKFPIFRESSSKLFLPIQYGIKEFGQVLPENYKIGSGKNIDFNCRIELRDYQKEAYAITLKALRATKGGVLSVPCSFGKTIMSIKAIHAVKKKAIIVVDRLNILNQWWEEIEAWTDAKVGIIQGKKLDIAGKDIVLAMIHTISMKDLPPDTFAEFGIAVYDEIHCMAAETFSKAFPVVCTKYNIGLSATVERKDGLSKVFKSFIGDVYHTSTMSVKNKKTIVNVVKYSIEDPNGLTKHINLSFGKQTANTAAMITNMAANKVRTNVIISYIKILAADPERQILVLSDRKQHLRDMHDHLSKAGVSCGLYVGNMPQSHLDLTCKKQVILGIYNLCQKAFNLKKLNTLIITTPRAEIQQIEGRILRQEHDINPIILDMADWWSHTFKNQWRTRLGYFKSRDYFIHEINLGTLPEINNLPLLKTDWLCN